MPEETEQQEPKKAPTIEEQNPFPIHTESEEDRRAHFERVAKFAGHLLLQGLARQHPVVDELIAEVEQLRELVASKKGKKPYAN